jgi:hypothetical protein
MSSINDTNKVYKSRMFISVMKKKVNVTLDDSICVAIDNIRSQEKFKPSFSQVVNNFLADNSEIKKRLKKNGK